MQVIVAALPLGVLAPHVTVTVTNPPTGTVAVTVQRTAGRRTFDVRGFIDARADGSLFGRDFEAPFGLSTRYTATAVDDAGATIGTAQSAQVILQSTVPASILVHDPIRPSTSTLLTLDVTAIDGGAREIDTEYFRIAGQSVPVSISSVRGGVTGIAFDAITYTAAAAERFDELFGGYDTREASGVLCIRPTMDIPKLVPRTFFASVARPQPTFVDANWGLETTHWALIATEVQPPAPALYQPVVAWEDLEAYWASRGGWAGFNAGYAVNADVDKDLRPRGAAG